jgi:hypothetical protein
MRKIWNLLEDDSSFPSLEDSEYSLVSADENDCDVMICGLEHVEYAGALVSPHECFFIVALDNPDHERHLVPNTFSAWIDRKRLNRLPSMLDAYRSHIDQKGKTRALRDTLRRFSVDTSVHYANLEGIKLNMRESTKEIETIFEERVEEMRAIHKDTTLAHDKLTALKEQIVPKEFNDLEESWNMTRAILDRTDEVIKAMFGFIMVLQCEDRITQMIDGIGKIMDDDITYAAEMGCILTPDEETALKERLVPFYTIQDQRDFVQGKDGAMQKCKPDQSEIDEFTLF